MPSSAMPRYFLFTALSLLAALLLLLAAVYFFRESLARIGANHVLADQQITVTRLQGLHLGSDSAAIDVLELELASGQRLVLSSLESGFVFTSVRTAPTVELVELASAQLLPATSPVEDADDDNAPLLLSDLLQQLREFPLNRVAIANITVPQWPEPFSLNLEHQAGELSLRLDSSTLQLHAGFTQADATDAALIQASLTRSDEAVGNFQLSLEPAQTGFNLEGSGHLGFADLNALLGALQQSSLPIPLQSVSVDWDLAGTVADELSGNFSSPPVGGAADTSKTFVLGIASGSRVTLPAGLSEGLGEFSLAFSDRAEVNVVTGSTPGVSTGHLPLSVQGSWQEQSVNVDALFTVTGCDLTTTAVCRLGFDGNAGYGEFTLAGKINAESAGLPSASGEYRLHTTDLEAGGLPDWMPAFDIDVNLLLDQDALSFSTPLLLRNAPGDAGITIEGQYMLASGAGNLHIVVPELEFSEEAAPLSAWFASWPWNFDLITGSVAADLALQLAASDDATAEASITAQMTGSLTDIAGFYGDIFFLGLNSALEASVESTEPVALGTPPLTLTIADVDAGVPLQNVAVNFQFDRLSQQVLIASLYAETLGGTLTGEDVVYDFDRARNDINLHFTGLQLQRMLALVEYEGVLATGAVSGVLPLSFTSTGLVVTQGTLQADAPGGSIRYLAGADAAPQSNAGLDLVNQALANYQFESLLSSIEYSRDGELLLSMQLQGHNPDLNDGQRINLNLNISDNIPSLLESLQAARVIEDFLEQQYQ